MRLSRHVTAAVACGAIAAVVGCGSAGPAGAGTPGASPSGRTTTAGHAGTTAITSSGCPAPAPGTPPADRKAEARLRAGVLLCDFAVPDGARRLHKAPVVDGTALTGGFGKPMTRDVIERYEWWLAPGTPKAVLSWERKHVLGGLKYSGGGWESDSSGVYLWIDNFSSAASPRWLLQQQLSVTVAALGKDTAIAVNAEVTWDPPRPATEKVPAGAKAVTITEKTVSKKEPRKTVTITDPGKVRRLVTLVNDVPLSPAVGLVNCPAWIKGIVTLKFRAAPGGAPLAVALDVVAGCSGLSLTIGGKEQPALMLIPAKAIFQAAGLSWKLP